MASHEVVEGSQFARDGVHKSAVGMPRYVSSIRSAAVTACAMYLNI